MGIVMTVKNVANNSTIKMDVEPNETMADIIDSASEYWKKDSGSYVLKKGKSLLKSKMTVSEVGIINGDVLELIPDPEGGSQ